MELYDLLVKSFPDLSKQTYWKVNNGKHFVEWVWGEYDDSQIICCAAIFRDHESKDAYKMGLFCVHPDYRGQGIGTHFYQYIMKAYKKVKWSTITDEAQHFYRKQGAIELGSQKGTDSRIYLLFSNY